jgi:hypothetical protein
VAALVFSRIKSWFNGVTSTRSVPDRRCATGTGQNKKIVHQFYNKAEIDCARETHQSASLAALVHAMNQLLWDRGIASFVLSLMCHTYCSENIIGLAKNSIYSLCFTLSIVTI